MTSPSSTINQVGRHRNSRSVLWPGGWRIVPPPPAAAGSQSVASLAPVARSEPNKSLAAHVAVFRPVALSHLQTARRDASNSGGGAQGAWPQPELVHPAPNGEFAGAWPQAKRKRSACIRIGRPTISKLTVAYATSAAKTLRLNQAELTTALNKSSSESNPSSSTSSSVATGRLPAGQRPQAQLARQASRSAGFGQPSEGRRPSSVRPSQQQQQQPPAGAAAQEADPQRIQPARAEANQPRPAPSQMSPNRRGSTYCELHAQKALSQSTSQPPPQSGSRPHQSASAAPLAEMRRRDERPAAGGPSIQRSPQQPQQPQVAARSAPMAVEQQQQMNWQRRQSQVAYIQLQKNHLINQNQPLQRPQTIVTASSEASVAEGNAGSRRSSQTAHLISIPPDQMHLRRLSDQSNLVRRSSIVAETLDGGLVARNRSHSNIDSVACASYLNQVALFQQHHHHQQQLHQHHHHHHHHHHQQQQQVAGSARLAAGHNYSEENISADLQQLQLPAYGQQRRLSDQFEQIQRLQANQQQQLSSIVTSYAQKSRRSSDEIRSNSSSDIDEDLRAPPSGFDYDESEQPSEYFAQPHPLGSGPYGLQTGVHGGQYKQQQQIPQMAIPSVSVSEFAPSQQQQLFRDQDQLAPMQINVAIEQAIQQQQQLQQQQRLWQQRELLPAGQQAVGLFLAPRRGSSGRILPKIPGEQSRSLLELPLNVGPDGAASGGGAGANSAADGQTLDLPLASPTIRRASAPEGQNIKIVVDDIDGSGALQGGRYGPGAKGDLCERLILYRDDSLDLNGNNLGRAFGLQVNGGKIDAEGRLQALVVWVLPGGPADKVGLRPGDTIVDWDGKCLVDMSYEQVAEVIESSANTAELLVRPAQRLGPEPGANYVRSQRRLSQQTERDLRRFQEQQQQPLGAQHQIELYDRNQRRMSAQLSGQRPLEPDQQRQQQGASRRRLPQIPTDLLCAHLPHSDHSLRHGSTGQLEFSSAGTGRYPPQNGLAGHHLNTALQEQQPQQQSRSASELYYGQLPAGQQPVSVYQQAAYPQGLVQQQFAGLDPSNAARLPYPVGQNGLDQSTGGGQYYSNCGLVAQPDEHLGLIGLQVHVDERLSQLEISILSAINIERNPSLDYYVRVRILPERLVLHFRSRASRSLDNSTPARS